MFSLTTDAVGVFVRSTQEVRQGHEQGGEAGQQSPASNESRPVDSAPKETHKDDKDSVSHLDMTQQCECKDSPCPALCILLCFSANFIKSSQHPRLLTGETVTSLDGGDGALHVAGHQKLCQLQQTVTEHEELQRRRRRWRVLPAVVARVKLRLSSSVRLQKGSVLFWFQGTMSGWTPGRPSYLVYAAFPYWLIYNYTTIHQSQMNKNSQSWKILKLHFGMKLSNRLYEICGAADVCDAGTNLDAVEGAPAPGWASGVQVISAHGYIVLRETEEQNAACKTTTLNLLTLHPDSVRQLLPSTHKLPCKSLHPGFTVSRN